MACHSRQRGGLSTAYGGWLPAQRYQCSRNCEPRVEYLVGVTACNAMGKEKLTCSFSALNLPRGANYFSQLYIFEIYWKCVAATGRQLEEVSTRQLYASCTRAGRLTPRCHYCYRKSICVVGTGFFHLVGVSHVVVQLQTCTYVWDQLITTEQLHKIHHSNIVFE